MRTAYYPLLSIACGLLMAASLSIGAMSIAWGDLFFAVKGLVFDLISNDDPLSLVQFLIVEVRLPRTITALFVGASLAAAGVAMQGLFRNPLADPSLIGVSSGASLGAVCVIVLLGGMGATTLSYLLPMGAFLGGIVATVIVYKIATHLSQTDTALLLLAGIAVNAIAGSGVGLLSYFANDQALRDLTLWSMGSVAKSSWVGLAIASPILMISCLKLLSYRALLNALVMGEAVAGHIGHDVKKLKIRLLILTTLIVSTAVSISGVIMFLGLVVPHLLRLLIGADHKHLLPLSMLLGASVLLIADIFSRLVIAPAELPIGLVMSFIGAPFFIFLLLKQKRQRAIG